jgi:hypothetical protein
MTPEERIQQLEQQLSEAQATIGTLETNVKNQNSYITKLEQQRQNPQTQQPAGNASLDPLVQKYIEDKMRADTLAKAEAQIQSEVSMEQYEAVKDDFHKFLDSTLTKHNTTVNYMVDAFSLVMGRALRNKEHPIHQISPNTKVMPGDQQAVDQPAIPTNGTTIANVQQTLANMPPIMTDKDTGASYSAPPTDKPIKNTRDAFQSLKSKFSDMGGNKFQ